MDPIKDWLDGIRPAYGERFAACFAEIGAECMEDIAEITQDATVELENELKVGDLVMRRLNPHELKKAADRGPYKWAHSVRA